MRGFGEYRARRARSVFGFYEQRLYGLVQIATGLATVVLGKYAPNWTLKYVMWGAARDASRQIKGPTISQIDIDRDYID